MSDPLERRQRKGHSDPTDDLELDRRSDAGRRDALRIPLRIWAEGRVEGRVEFYNCSNVSTGGLFLESTEPWPLDTRLTVEFQLPDDGPPMRAIAEVVSSLDANQAGESLMGNGIRFLQLDLSDRERVARYIESLTSSSDPT
jgi:uncharacterized protein (TIGR02266 family)